VADLWVTRHLQTMGQMVNSREAVGKQPFSFCHPWPLVIVTVGLCVGFLIHLEMAWSAFLGTNSNVEIVDDQAQSRLSHLVLAVMKVVSLVMLRAMFMSDMYCLFFFPCRSVLYVGSDFNRACHGHTKRLCQRNHTNQLRFQEWVYSVVHLGCPFGGKKL
jgi:hypothetical protein